jgi:uncharacterized membrane protein YedE/YeeE
LRASLTSFVSGIIFALGLGIAGMTRPIKVIGFLDFFGSWDPSLACVMVGAVAVYFIANRCSQTMRAPLLAAKFVLPTRTDLDARLIIGAAVFGAGWGLGGFCPGPAITSLASGAFPVIVFFVAMVAGTSIQLLTTEYRVRSPQGFTIGTQPAPDS